MPLIAFEGVDGSGKSSQIAALRKRLEADGHRVSVLREPGGTQLGEQLRDMLLERERDPVVEAMLFMASRRQLVVECIEPALRNGDVVLLDRSFVSTWVYQGIVGGTDLAFLEELARRVHGTAWPDRVLLLDLGVDEAARRRAQRGRSDGFEARGDAFLERVADGFREIAERHAELVHVVDANDDLAVVAQRCWDAVADLFR